MNYININSNQVPAVLNSSTQQTTTPVIPNIIPLPWLKALSIKFIDNKPNFPSINSTFYILDI
jgi:hypothetical protein